jgi:hypothetical protein
LSKHAAYTPKHRGAVERPLVDAPKKALKKTLILSTVAVAGTGTVVGGGLVLAGGTANVTMAADLANPVAAVSTPAPAAPSTSASSSASASAAAAAVRDRTTVSRSEDRDAVDPAKEAALGGAGTAARAVVQTEDLGVTGDPKTIASALLPSYGWSGDQFDCLVNLWTKESGWNVHAANPSGAYGIPQSLPGSKMASAGADWQDNAETQIKWGLGYIADRYGSPCGAWGHSESYNWY